MLVDKGKPNSNFSRFQILDFSLVLVVSSGDRAASRPGRWPPSGQSAAVWFGAPKVRLPSVPPSGVSLQLQLRSQ